MKISVIGTGYVGLVTGTCFAEMGHEVTCLDINKTKIENLRKGILPIYEPGLEEMVTRCTKEKRLFFTTEYSEAVNQKEVVFIAVGTPPGEDGSADLKYVISAAESIANAMDQDLVIVNKSTVPVGTSHKVRDAIKTTLKKRNSNLNFSVVSNPEFLKEGTAIEDFMKPDRIVVGVDSERARTQMAQLYEPFVRNGHPILFMDLESSEMTKYAANALLATKISFINEISTLCEKLGADIEKVRKGIGSDRRIGHHFIYPGLGYGGSCFPKDVKALLQTGNEMDEPMHLINAVEKVNQAQRQRFIGRVLSHFQNNLRGKKIALWGLAFKPGTDDIREAPSIDITQALLKAGATVTAYDPVAAGNFKKELGNTPGAESVTYVEHPYDGLKNADALCLITEWKAFREPDFEKIKALMKSPVIFDGRNQYSPERLSTLGIQYFSVGRK